MEEANVRIQTNAIDISQTFGLKKRISKVEHAVDLSKKRVSEVNKEVEILEGKN